MYKALETKTFNFNAGPAMLPEAVMNQAKEEFLSYKNSGMSVMEISHRGALFEEILVNAENSLRKLLNIPNTYSVVFFPGGATYHFSSIPLNLLNENESADYIVTGVWAKKAYEEALKYSSVKKIWTSTDFLREPIPEVSSLPYNQDAKYIYITSNNTIFGSRYKKFPKNNLVPLVADMTSDILSRRIDIRDFGIVFAGAQKNIGPSGLTVMIIRNDLIPEKPKKIPVLMDFHVMAKNKSLYNTPPTFSIYIAGLVFNWCLEQGGLDSIESNNIKKSEKLYSFIDNSKLYHSPVPKEYRSIMNAVFLLKNEDLNKKFAGESEENGLVGLPGHRDAGGFRASIYNAMPMEGIDRLIEFMQKFESCNC